jgi:proline iminopeptidase
MLALADDYELVFYDQRGGGRSKTDGRDVITWQTQVDDLALVAAELIAGPLTLVGYSWGGLLAMLYAAARRTPYAVRLILIDPAPPSRAHRREFAASLAERQNSEWVLRERASLTASGIRESDPEAFRQRSFELSVAGYFHDPSMARELTPFRVTSRVQQSIWESLGAFDLLPSLRDLHVPALVIHGRQDPIPLASSQAVATALSGRLVVLDDCGHVPYVERPAPLFAAVRAFLRDVPPRGSEQT